MFKLWEGLHGTLSGRKPKLGAQDALQQLKALRRGQAGSLALAACWKGVTDKVRYPVHPAQSLQVAACPGCTVEALCPALCRSKWTP